MIDLCVRHRFSREISSVFPDTFETHVFFIILMTKQNLSRNESYEEIKTQRRASIDVNLLKRPVSCARQAYIKNKNTSLKQTKLVKIQVDTCLRYQSN